jgi:hypothetical protein
VAGIKPISLRVLATPPQPGHVRRLGQMRDDTRGLAFLDDEPPSRATLYRQLHPCTGKSSQPFPEQLPIRRADPTSPHLTGVGVYYIEGDLLPVQI